MKNSAQLIIYSFILVLLASCIKEEAILEGAQYELMARMETDARTKTSLSGLQDGKYYPLWSTGDRIAVFVDGDTDPNKFALTSGEGTTQATFAGTRYGKEYYALYPFVDTIRMENGVIYFTLPEIQEYVTGSFASGNYPMIATGTRDSLDFINLCAILKISMKGNAAIRSITVTAKDTLTYLSGTASVSVGYGNEPELKMNAGGINSVMLECKGIELDKNDSTDFYIVVPAQTYKGGFELSVDVYSKVIKKSIDTDIEFKRSQIRHLKNVELNVVVDGNQSRLVREKETLIAFYKALGGDNWENKSNWCSSEPVGKWFGVSVDANGYVIGLNLTDNNLSGIITPEIKHLIYLTSLTLQGNIQGNIPPEITKLKKLEVLSLRGKLTGSIPEDIGYLKELTTLDLLSNNLTGSIPESIGNMVNLRKLQLQNNSFTGNLPSQLGNCENLRELLITTSSITGSIPPSLGNCKNLTKLYLWENNLTGTIPESLSNCTKLSNLQLQENQLSGELPKEIATLPLKTLNVAYNNLSGDIPLAIMSKDIWNHSWGSIIAGNGFNIQDLNIPALVFDVIDINGKKVNSNDVYKRNKYTLLYKFSSTNSRFHNLDKLKKIYSKFSEHGFDIIGYSWYMDDYKEVCSYVSNNKIEWTTIHNTAGNYLSSLNKNYPHNVNPAYTLVDSLGRVVYYKLDAHLSSDISSLETYLLENIDGITADFYISTDYSMDGTTVQLQKASEGNGINIVLMGDGYSDRQIADGTYKADMEYAYNSLFVKEPYKSFKNRFNISYVNVVSATEGIEHETALNCGFGEGSRVFGNDEKCFSYAQKVVSEQQMDETLVVVVMNSNKHAGTCYMFNPEKSGNDYGSGAAVAYFPKGRDAETFAELLHHEACGHGFTKLADEYAYESNGAIPSDEVERIKNQHNIYGWWKNVDFTNDPAQVRWKKFLEDSRYANEGLGVFEGGLTYWSGVWRPTENSIMRHNRGEFNAPSREAIYYRIHKLAYGEDWKYDYEKFVEYDAVNRKSSAASTKSYVLPLKPQPALHPPVVVGKNWREAE